MPVTAHATFEEAHAALGLRDLQFLGRTADQQLAVCLHAHHRRREHLSQRIRNQPRTILCHPGNRGIGGSQIDTHDNAHCDHHSRLRMLRYAGYDIPVPSPVISQGRPLNQVPGSSEAKAAYRLRPRTLERQPVIRFLHTPRNEVGEVQLFHLFAYFSNSSPSEKAGDVDVPLL